MQAIRRRIARVFENFFAMAVGAFVVALAQGMSPAEILEAALINADKVPGMVSQMITMEFASILG